MAQERDVNPTRPREEPPELAAWRKRIDAIDGQLLALLNSRAACAVEVGRLKQHLGLAVYSPEREAWILERVVRDNPGPLDPLAARRLFERVIDESRRLERLASEASEPDKGPASDRPEER